MVAARRVRGLVDREMQTADSRRPVECSVQVSWTLPLRVLRYTPMSVPANTVVGLLGSIATVVADGHQRSGR